MCTDTQIDRLIIFSVKTNVRGLNGFLAELAKTIIQALTIFFIFLNGKKKKNLVIFVYIWIYTAKK